MEKTVKYNEGDVFTVPLRSGGFCLGVIARRTRSVIALGYFFSPRRTTTPVDRDIAVLRPEEVTLIKRFGALGIRIGEWHIVGRISNWNREEWLLPKFVRPGIQGTCTLVTYDEQTLVKDVVCESVPESESINYFFDGMAGYKAVEIELNRMLP